MNQHNDSAERQLDSIADRYLADYDLTIKQPPPVLGSVRHMQLNAAYPGLPNPAAGCIVCHLNQRILAKLSAGAFESFEVSELFHKHTVRRATWKAA